MIQFVYFLFLSAIGILILRALGKKHMANAALILVLICLFNTSVIWYHEQKVKWNKKMEGVNKNIQRVEKSIDKLGDTADKINNNPVVKGTKKATNAIDKADKKIKDYGFKVREKITGKKTKRLEE